MSGGGGGGTTNTITNADPWSGQQPYLQDIYQRAQNAANKTQDAPLYGGRFTPAVNQQQITALDMLTDQANRAQGQGDAAINLGQRTLAGEFLNGNNYLRPAIEATVNPIIRQTREQLLPGISSAAQSQGAFGGSRQGLLEAQTIRDTNAQVADTAAKMLYQNYGDERKMQQMATALVQQGQGMNLLPAQLMGQVGQSLTAVDANEIQNALAQQDYTRQAPWAAVNPYVAAISGLGTPGGSQTTRAQQLAGSPVAGALTGAVGGAALGYTGGAMMGAQLGSSAGPYGALAGAVIGGLLGAFS